MPEERCWGFCAWLRFLVGCRVRPPSVLGFLKPRIPAFVLLGWVPGGPAERWLRKKHGVGGGAVFLWFHFKPPWPVSFTRKKRGSTPAQTKGTGSHVFWFPSSRRVPRPSGAVLYSLGRGLIDQGRKLHGALIQRGSCVFWAPSGPTRDASWSKGHSLFTTLVGVWGRQKDTTHFGERAWHVHSPAFVDVWPSSALMVCRLGCSNPTYACLLQW